MNNRTGKGFPGVAGLFALFPKVAPFALLLFVASCGGGPTSRVIPTPGTPGTQGLKGWQKPYVVAGQRYEPLLSSDGYVEEGVASWYGRDFHGQRTSNGEVYDMYAMTAAHKILPLGISVKVRNLRNGREIVVRLNDRGPFVKGRIIDLSYTAARQLGIADVGTCPVRIEALGYREQGSGGAPVYRAPATYEVGAYAVQVGAFESPANAQRMAAAMKSRFGAAIVNQGWVGNRHFHRVWVGHYPTLAAAETACAQFERSGYPNSFVVALD